MKIYGKNPVLERIKSNPKSVRHIYVQAGHPEHSYIALKAKKYGLPVTVVDQRRMLKLGRSLNTQGLLLEVEDFGYSDYDDCLETAAAEKITFLFVDGLNDPQNLGAIIRSVACLGGFVIVLPTHDSVHVTDSVMRVACGGENYVRVCKVNNLNNAIQKAKEKGFWIAGSVVKGGKDLRQVKFPFPLGIVVGGEDKGIREVVQQRLDVKITIPMAHQRMSLNAAHATSIICYETTRQKNIQGRPFKPEIEPQGPAGEEYLPE